MRRALNEEEARAVREVRNAHAEYIITSSIAIVMKRTLIFGVICLCFGLSSCQCSNKPDIGPVENPEAQVQVEMPAGGASPIHETSTIGPPAIGTPTCAEQEPVA